MEVKVHDGQDVGGVGGCGAGRGDDARRSAFPVLAETSEAILT